MEGAFVICCPLSPLLLEKRVSRSGASSAKLSVLNRMENIVAITYGIANFSIGRAKDNNLKYVFINKKFRKVTQLFMLLKLNSWIGGFAIL